MITQDIQLTAKSVMTCDFGKGNIAVGLVSPGDSGKVLLTFSNMKENQEIGADVVGDNVHDTPLIMQFDSIKSLEVIKGQIERAMEMMRGKTEHKAAPEKPVFTVPYDRIYVTSAFCNSKPSPQQIMDCLSNYQKTGKINRDIVVNENLTLLDGYIGYLVAGYSGVSKLKVVAPDGIKMNLMGTVTFKSNKIGLSYERIEKTGIRRYHLVIENCGKRYEIPASLAYAVAYLKKIREVFEPEFIFHKEVASTPETNALIAMMDKEAIAYRIVEKVTYKTVD